MNNKNKFFGFLVWLVVILTFSFRLFLIAEATDYGSANFIDRDPVNTDFGGYSTSTNFQQINAGNQNAIGESTSTNFILRSGFLYFDTYSPKSQNWRWYGDISNETPTTSMAAENTAPSAVNPTDNLKLRITVKETGNVGSGNIKFKLQYSQTSNFAIVTDVVSTSSCVSTSVWCYTDAGAGADNVKITTKTLSDADACVASAGTGCGTHNTSGTSTSTFTQLKNTATEFEFAIKNSGAPLNTTYFFRLFDVTNNLPVPVNTSEVYPSLVTAGATLTFTVNGLNAGTSTAGLTTNATTTPTDVTFGHLVFNQQTAAAQRLTINTNASQGYELYVFQNQALIGPGEIVPVSSTNIAPAAWSIPSGAAGAYGYHTTASVLNGGSTRFAPNDSYAKFESASREIGYSSGPVTSQPTDLVFKTQVTTQQPAGQYSGSITYIVVPTF